MTASHATSGHARSPVTVGGFLELARNDRERGAELIVSDARDLLRGHAFQDQDDLCQELFYRVWRDDYELLRRIKRKAVFRTVLCGVLKNIERERARKERRQLRDLIKASKADIAEVSLPTAVEVSKLPLPYCKIAELKLRLGFENKRVTDYLISWRPIGKDEARRLVRETNRMVRCLITGGDPAAQWPRRYRKKNLWNSIPPRVPGH